MFFEQSRGRGQNFVIRSADGQIKFSSKSRLYDETNPINQSPYKKRISFNFFSKNKISKTQQIYHRQSIKPINFQIQFNDSNVHQMNVANKNIFIKPNQYEQHIIRPKYDTMLKCNQMKLNPYVQTYTTSNLKNSFSTTSNAFVTPMTTQESKSQTIKSFENSNRKSKIHRSLIFSNTDTSYKFYVTNGNNHQLLERVMRRRQKFTFTSQANSMINFKWTQTSDKIKFNYICSLNGLKQVVNHFQFHDEITTKSGILRNLRSKCEKEQKQHLFEIVPITFEIDFSNLEQVENQIKKFMNFYVQHHPSRASLPKNKRKQEDYKLFVQYIKKLKPICNVQNFSYDKKQNPFTKPLMKDIYQTGNNTYLWLLKPTSLNRGRGIYLFQTIDQLFDIFEEYLQRNQQIRSSKQRQSSSSKTRNDIQSSPLTKLNKYIRSSSFVIQKYIQKPLLVDKRKFDIRVWVLITHNMQLYFFKQGYIRTSCKQFEIEKKDLFVHLTNNAIQKNSEQYGQFEDGNQLSFKNLQTQFMKLQQQKIANDSEYKPISFIQDCVPEMKRMIHFSIDSVKKKLNLNNRKYCFQLFGYDFMIDKNFKLWLIQVNTNPCIQQSSPLLKMLLPRMLDDAMQLTIDQIFKIKKTTSPYPVWDYSNDENMWELLADLKIQQPKK